jgi:hypothetical protein
MFGDLPRGWPYLIYISKIPSRQPLIYVKGVDEDELDGSYIWNIVKSRQTIIIQETKINQHDWMSLCAKTSHKSKTCYFMNKLATILYLKYLFPCNGRV